MKITKLKVLAASAALSVSLLSGCCIKLETIKQPQYNERIEKYDRIIEKYDRIIEMIKTYDDLVPGKDYAEEKILVGFDEETTKEEANNLIESYDKNNELEMLSYFSEIKCAVIKVPKGKEQAYTLFFQNMSDETIVKYAELDYIVRIQD